MQQRTLADQASSLSELLGTYLQLSARFAPPSYSLRTVASAVNELDSQRSGSRLLNTNDAPASEEVASKEI